MSILDIRKLPEEEVDQVQFADPEYEGIYSLRIKPNRIEFINNDELPSGCIYDDEIDDLIAALKYIQKSRLNKQEKL